MGRKILFDGKIKFIDSVNIKLDSPALNYGLGLFETILYENGKIYFLDNHLERMKRSCNELNLPKPDISSISIEAIYDLIESNDQKNDSCKIKIIYAPLTDNSKWNLLVSTGIYCRNTDPIQAFVEPKIRESSFYKHKTISYMQNLILSDARPESEILFLNSKGNIIEGSKSNILCVKDDILFCVNNQDNYLVGIMQEKILSDYKSFGLKAVSAIKNGFSFDLLRQCSEIIITNSLIVARNINYLTYNNEEIKLLKMDLSESIRRFYLDS